MLQPELMDDPAIDPAEHDRALAGLARINRLSFAARAHLPALTDTAEKCGGRVRVLDVAAGSGDIGIGLARLAARRSIRVDLTLTDISPTALAACKRRTEAGRLSVEILAADAVRGPLPPCDLAVCSLFLHHLDDAAAVRVLENMNQAARVGGSVNDLRRVRGGNMLADVVPRIVTRSEVVHADAAISARAAYTPDELQRMAMSAGLRAATVRRTFPARMTMTWGAS